MDNRKAGLLYREERGARQEHQCGEVSLRLGGRASIGALHEKIPLVGDRIDNFGVQRCGPIGSRQCQVLTPAFCRREWRRQCQLGAARVSLGVARIYCPTCYREVWGAERSDRSVLFLRAAERCAAEAVNRMRGGGRIGGAQRRVSTAPEP